MQKDNMTKQVLRLLFWESTVQCNLHCSHCRRLSVEESKNQLSTEEAKSLLASAEELGRKQGVMPVIVFSGGEPLCRPDILDLARIAREGGLATALATNGTLIDWKLAEAIRDSGISRVSVSLDGAKAQTHDEARGLEGSFDRAIDGINELSKFDVPVQINMTLTRANADELQQTYELARDLGAVALHVFILVPVGCGQEIEESQKLSPDEYEEKLKEILELENRGEIALKVTCGPHYQRIVRECGGVNPEIKRGEALGRGSRKSRGKGCLAGLGVLFVGHTGDVFPCGYLPVLCGNVREQSLSDIWYGSEKLARMRDTEQLEGKCGVCGYKHICGGCRARAYSETGDFMAEEPFCAYIPPKHKK